MLDPSAQKKAPFSVDALKGGKTETVYYSAGPGGRPSRSQLARLARSVKRNAYALFKWPNWIAAQYGKNWGAR